MWTIQEPKKVALWNKRHFEEKNGECAACLKYSVLIFVEKKYIKCNIWRVAVCPSYIWDARFLKVNPHWKLCQNTCISLMTVPVLDVGKEWQISLRSLCQVWNRKHRNPKGKVGTCDVSSHNSPGTVWAWRLTVLQNIRIYWPNTLDLHHQQHCCGSLKSHFNQLRSILNIVTIKNHGLWIINNGIVFTIV